MMKLSNFLSLSILILALLVVLVQSSNSEPSKNETLRNTASPHKKIDWRPYVCDMEMLNRLNLLYLVPDSDLLYFYFPQFVIRIRKVEIHENYLRKDKEGDQENFFLTYGEPEFANYADMEVKPSLLNQNATVFYQIFWPKENETYAYINEKSSAYQLLFTDEVAGELGKNWYNIGKWIKDEMFEFGFVIWDDKWLQIWYNNRGKRLSFEVIQKKASKGKMTLHLTYEVRFVAYYELKSSAPPTIIGHLLEVDKNDLVHLHRYTFIVNSNTKGMTIYKSFEFNISLTEFFGCRKGRKFEKREFKGIYFSSYTYMFYVFINDFYLKGELDMVNRNFQIVQPLELVERAKEVLFKDSKPSIERRSIKYIKQTKCRNYFTVNLGETYKLEEKRGESADRKGDEQLVAEKIENKLVYLCPNQILEIGGIAFCFESSVYYYASNDDFKTYNIKPILHSIKDIFENTNITFPTDQRLHFLSNFIPGPPKSWTRGDLVLFVFDHVIFQIDRRFLAVRPIGSNDYTVYLRSNLGDFQIIQTTNCLFVSAEDCKPERQVFKNSILNGRKYSNEALDWSTDIRSIEKDIDESNKMKEMLFNETLTKPLKFENESSPLVALSLLLVFILLFVASLLFVVKLSGGFNRSGRNVAETKVSKSDDLKLNELKKYESTRSIGSLVKKS